MGKADILLLGTLFGLALVAIGTTGYSYWYNNAYPVVVEAECDPEVQNCFYRDCEEADACPPNGLSVYTVYSVSARDFDTCADNSCKQECESGAIACEEIVCGEAEEDACIIPNETDEPVNTENQESLDEI